MTADDVGGVEVELPKQLWAYRDAEGWVYHEDSGDCLLVNYHESACDHETAVDLVSAIKAAAIMERAERECEGRTIIMGSTPDVVRRAEDYCRKHGLQTIQEQLAARKDGVE